MNHKSGYRKLHIILFLATLETFLLLFDSGGILPIQAHDADLFKDIVPILLFHFTTYALFLFLLLSGAKPIRIAAYCILFVTTLTSLIFKFIYTEGFDLNAATLILREYSFGGEVLKTFLGPIAAALSTGAVFVAATIFVNEKWIPKLRYKTVTALPLIAFLVPYALVADGGFWSSRLTLPVKVPMTLLTAAKRPVYVGERDPVISDAKNETPFRKIILIVDESVRGDHLSLNGYPRETTPFLNSIRSDIINFGIASSGANCSAPSNIILQSGVKESDLPDNGGYQKILKSPNLFQYAKNAGYATYFMDAQNPTDHPQDYMTAHDIERLDHYLQIKKLFPDVQEPDLDYRLADRVIEAVRKEKSVFIYAIKFGAHYHYDSAYPKTEKRFAPTMAVGDPTHSEESRQRTINSYDNAVRWATDGFFKHLVAGLKNENYVIVYTSDHGQALLDGQDLSPHCTTESPLPVQANVPLWILPSASLKKPLDEMTAPYLKKNLDRVSHFAVFPSVLFLEGYDKADIHSNAGKTLFDDASQTTRHFYSGDLWGYGKLVKTAFP